MTHVLCIVYYIRHVSKFYTLFSIAFHFRYMLDDENAAQRERRTAILAKICQTLNKLAVEHKLAVLVTNQATVRFKNGEYVI